MQGQEVVQVRDDAPNPVLELGDYTPITSYWSNIIRLANAMILASAMVGQGAKTLQHGANVTITSEIFIGEHTAAEWAEFVMGINHILWLLHHLHEKRVIEYLEPVLQALNDLYYEWHSKALDTLTDDDLSEYLRITD
jgi:hypothetical protein